MASRCREGDLLREICLRRTDLQERLKPPRPPSPDDASITTDGRHLDSEEKVLKFLAEFDAAWPAEVQAGNGTNTPEHPPDTPRVIACLNRHAVDYLIVGGVAAIVHGAARPTGDVDCLADGCAENLHRLAVAMRELNARLRIARPDGEDVALLPVPLDEVMLVRTEVSVWRTDAGNVDVLTALPGPGGRLLRYDELAERADLAVIEGRHAPVASLDDLINSKAHRNRPKDRQVIAELRDLYPAQIAVKQEKAPNDGDCNSAEPYGHFRLPL